MRVRTWWLENIVLLLVLGAVVRIAPLPLDGKTAGWALALLGTHTLRSHAERQREDAGKPRDWLSTCAGWAVQAGALLAVDAPQRGLLGASLAAAVAFSLWRAWYRP